MKTAAPLALADFRALAEFRHQIRRFLRVSEEAARAAGIEPQQHQLLLAIAGAPAGEVATIAWLAERLQLRHHSIVGLVDRLAVHGLVKRQRDVSDQRRVVVTLTRRGHAILSDLSRLHRAEIRSRAPELAAAMAAIISQEQSS